MKLLLTSQMIHNQSIADALAALLDKPYAEVTVAYIITSHNAALGDKSWLVQNMTSLHDLGWKEFHIIDIAGVDGLPDDVWLPKVIAADVIVIGGGANYFLSYWLEKSGLLQLLPSLLADKVYVGASAGSMIMQPDLCTSSQAMSMLARGEWETDQASLGFAGRSSTVTFGLVDFLIRPHYGSAGRVEITDELLQQVAHRFDRHLYALDDDSALVVRDGDVITVVSEGKWRLFEPN